MVFWSFLLNCTLWYTYTVQALPLNFPHRFSKGIIQFFKARGGGWERLIYVETGKDEWMVLGWLLEGASDG
jgi:hypothetical protein